ncbi:MAG: ABC transporter ATP-binding protein [Methylicorpusculum sp.]|nr:ABC transporter ATP-binding protein [Methylicorpusculum sp.]
MNLIAIIQALFLTTESVKTMTSAETAITLQQVTKSYWESGLEQTILDNVTVNIRQGELIVLLGRSGSGKSTLLNLLSGIDQPNSGRVNLMGTDLTALPENERTLFRRRHIGFVFQAYNLIPTLTVLENLLLPLELLHRMTDTDVDKALNLLDQLDLKPRQDSYPDRLSGGEQQRIAIARSLIHEPAIVLADEPTGNLDLETGKQVLALLDTLVRQTGKTMIMATHSQEVMGLADRVFTIRDKTLVTVEKTL